MKMDQTTLNAYLEKSAEKDEDAMIIQKYARQDESKIKELTLKVQSLQDNQMKNRRDLDKERTETISAQVCPSQGAIAQQCLLRCLRAASMMG